MLDGRGHGKSGTASGDFGSEGWLDALVVMESSKAEQVIPGRAGALGMDRNRAAPAFASPNSQGLSSATGS